jgi:hypothetical protein
MRVSVVAVGWSKPGFARVAGLERPPHRAVRFEAALGDRHHAGSARSPMGVVAKPPLAGRLVLPQ